MTLNGNPALILIAAVDDRQQAMLIKHLESHGFCFDSSDQSSSGLILAADHHSLLVVPCDRAADALVSLCGVLRRQWPAHRILLVVAEDSYHLRASALDAGADEAISCPFALEELMARVRALFRRCSAPAPKESLPAYRYSCRDLLLDSVSRSVARAGDEIRLTVKEFDLLHYLVQHKEQVLPRKQILHAVWGDTWVGDDNLLDVYIRYLRKKIERPDLEPLIHTIRGVGFMLK